MKHLIQAFLDRKLSRRDFAQALVALGVAKASIGSVVRAAEAANDVQRPSGRFGAHCDAGILDNEIFIGNICLGPRPGFNQKDINCRSFDVRGIH